MLVAAAFSDNQLHARPTPATIPDIDTVTRDRLLALFRHPRASHRVLTPAQDARQVAANMLSGLTVWCSG